MAGGVDKVAKAASSSKVPVKSAGGKVPGAKPGAPGKVKPGTSTAPTVAGASTPAKPATPTAPGSTGVSKPGAEKTVLGEKAQSPGVEKKTLGDPVKAGSGKNVLGEKAQSGTDKNVLGDKAQSGAEKNALGEKAPSGTDKKVLGDPDDTPAGGSETTGSPKTGTFGKLKEGVQAINSGSAGSENDSKAKQLGKDALQVGTETVKGAAQGASGGWTGAIAGAAKGLGKGVLKNKRARKLVVIALVLSVAFSPIVSIPLSLLIAIHAVNGDDSLQESSSDKVATATGVPPNELSDYAQAGDSTGVPRHMLASIAHIGNGGSFTPKYTTTGTEGASGGPGMPISVEGGTCPPTASPQVEAAIKHPRTSQSVKNLARCSFMVKPQFNEMGGVGNRGNNSKSDHPRGRALDIMITNYKKTTADGDALAAFIQKNQKPLNIKYIIWNARIWNPGRDKPDLPLNQWRSYTHPSGGGGDTLLHKDHIHVSVKDNDLGDQVDTEGVSGQTGSATSDTTSGGAETEDVAGPMAMGGGEPIQGQQADGVGPYKLDMDEIAKRAKETEGSDHEFPVITNEDAEDRVKAGEYIAKLLRENVPGDVIERHLDYGSHRVSFGNGVSGRAVPMSGDGGNEDRYNIVKRIQDEWIKGLKTLPINNIEQNAQPIFLLARSWALGVPPEAAACQALPVTQTQPWTLPVEGERVGLEFGKKFEEQYENADPFISPLRKETDTHLGVALQTGKDKPIRAPYDGKIIDDAEDYYVIDHGQDVHTVYAHVKDVKKKRGDTVVQGDVVAHTKNEVTHFQVDEKDKATDPVMFMSARGVTVGVKPGASSQQPSQSRPQSGQQVSDAVSNANAPTDTPTDTPTGGDSSAPTDGVSTFGDSFDDVDGIGRPIHLGKEELKNVSDILATGRALGANNDALVIAIMTALQESTMSYGVKNDRDSRGLFQQRPSSGWGTVEQLLDTEYATKAFFGGKNGPNYPDPPGLFDIKGWEQMTKNDAAQAVQRSGYPDAYGKWEEVAKKLVGSTTGTASCPDGMMQKSGLDNPGQNPGPLTDGGMSMEQAKQLTELYNNGDGDKVLGQQFPGGGGPAKCGSSWVKNCTSFSWYFVYKYTSWNKGYRRGDGRLVAGNVASGLGRSVSRTPKAYSIFSHGNSSASGHTGVVLAVQGDKILIGEAAYCGRSMNRGFPGRARWVKPGEWRDGGWEFADISDVVAQRGSV